LIKIINKKLKDSSKKWVDRQINDEFVKKKVIQGYRSRSAFKLIEMEKKFKIIKKNSNIIDLGSAPGGWSQVLSQKIGRGKIMAIDILPMKKVKNIEFILGDFLNSSTKEKILNFFGKKVDIIVSDMAANTTGNKNLDSYRTAELNLNTIEFSKNTLNESGILLCKLFMGSEFKEIKKKASATFKKVIFYKPSSSRKDSRELYMFCKETINKI